VPDGEPGELVLTTLTKIGMPVVRYRTRDLTRLLPGTARPAMRRIARVMGRSDDMLIIRGVNVFPTQIEAVLGKQPELAPHYLLEVTRPGRLDELEVVAELRPEIANSLGAKAQEGLERRTEQAIKSYIGVTTTVRVVPPATIERSPGKANRVADRRPKG
jgi:phenylacetate-CoA ligase